MKKLSFLLFAFFTLLLNINAQTKFVQKEFVIGANWAPFLTMASATPAYADYNGDGAFDLASRVNDGPFQGKFLIDYSSVATVPYPWFQSKQWSLITTAAIYGGASDFVVSGKYDADALADIAVYFPATKTWKIDYAANGFGAWQATFSYSTVADVDATAIPVPADYDGDGKTDISFKTAAGKWLIDYSANGFGTIDFTRLNCGNSTEHPVPANYDGKIDPTHPTLATNFTADISVKTDAQQWKIDYAANGFGTWDAIINGCGNQTSIPVPADYNGDGKADLSVKTNTGDWLVTYSFTNGTTVSWIQTAYSHGFGGTDYVPYPGDFNGDGKADFSFVSQSDGKLYVDDFTAAIGGYSWVSSPGKAANDYVSNSLNAIDQINYNKIKNCNFNLTVDYPMSGLSFDFQKDYYLSLMDNVGLNTMLSDPYIYSFGDITTSPFNTDAFVLHYRPLNRIYAINLGDEPSNLSNDDRCNCNPIARVGQWSNYFATSYPEKPTFNNLLPSYWGGFNGLFTNFTAYLDQYKANSNSPFICSDYYPFRTLPLQFWTSYFDDLSTLKNKFKDRNLWATAWTGISSTENISYPTEKKLQFSSFCPIAYGARGILYFPYDKAKNPTYSIAINNDATIYNNVKNINLFLKNIVGPVTIGSTNIATLHKAISNNGTVATTTYGYTLPSNSSELISNYQGIIKDVSDSDLIVGVFAKNDTTSDKKVLSVGNYYLWIMNKDTAAAANNITVTLRGNYLGNIQVSPRALNYVSNPLLTYANPSSPYYDAANNVTTFVIPTLNGGEGIMVKLFSSANEGCPADYDGDKIMDISIKEYDGTWLIDYSSNGFGNWDWWGTGYGNQTWHPVPADYNGDGRADLSVKMDDGRWFIDYSSITAANNGYSGWEFTNALGTYGDATAHPVPADYNGDGKADLSVKTDDGRWLIDYSGTGTNNGYLGWEFTSTIGTYGDATAHPVPADYNGDGKADLSVKIDDGRWLIDYSSTGTNNGFVGWEFTSPIGTYGNATSHPVPANYNGNNGNLKADLSVKVDDGRWLIDYADNSALPGNGFIGWEVTPPLIYGDQTAIPFPGDFGGDKSADMSIKYSNGNWKIDYSVNGFGSWDDIILNPVYNSVPGASGRPVANTSAIDASLGNCDIREDKQYSILSIYDITGRLFKDVNQTTSIRALKSRFDFKTGIYFVKIKNGDKTCTGKIFISN